MTIIFIQNVAKNMEYCLMERHLITEKKKGLIKIKKDMLGRCYYEN